MLYKEKNTYLLLVLLGKKQTILKKINHIESDSCVEKVKSILISLVICLNKFFFSKYSCKYPHILFELVTFPNLECLDKFFEHFWCRSIFFHCAFIYYSVFARASSKMLEHSKMLFRLDLSFVSFERLQAVCYSNEDTALL